MQERMQDRSPRVSTPTVATAGEPSRAGGHRPGFAVVVCVVVVVIGASSVPSPLYGIYGQQWQITPVASTVVYASYAAGVIGVLLAGGWMRSLPRRTLLVTAVATVVVASVLAATAHALWQLDAARVLQGVATGLVSATATAALTALHPGRNAARAAAATSAATAGSIGLGAAVSGALAQWAPAPLVTPYLAVGAAGILVIVALLTVPAATMHDRTAPTTPTAPTAPAPAVARARLSPSARRALRGVAVQVVVSWAVVGVYLALGVQLTARLLGTDDHAIASLIIVVVQVPAGLVQVLGRGWPAGRAASLGCAALLVGAALGIAGVRTEQTALFFTAAALVGVGFGLSFLATLRTVSEAAGSDERTRAVTCFFLLAYLAVSLPAVAGGLAQMRWGLDTTYSAFGAIVVLACAIVGVLLLRRRAGRPTTGG